MTDQNQVINRYAFLRSHATGYEITVTRSIEYKNVWEDTKTQIISKHTYQVNHHDMSRFYSLSSRIHSGVPTIDITAPKAVSYNDYLRIRFNIH